MKDDEFRSELAVGVVDAEHAQEQQSAVGSEQHSCTLKHT
jgi:hypothetical protein